MHGGAEAACVNVLLTDAGEDQLIPTSAYQVEAHSALAWCHEPTVDQVALVSSGGEGIDEIRADFIAAGTDRGAHRHDQVLGVTAELALHFVDCRHRDARRGSAPARMNGGNGTGARVGDEQRDAIGGRTTSATSGAAEIIASAIGRSSCIASSVWRETCASIRTTSRPWTWFSDTMPVGGTWMADASAHHASADGNWSCRVVNRCCANGSNGRQRRAAPHVSLLQ